MQKGQNLLQEMSEGIRHVGLFYELGLSAAVTR